MALGKRIRAMRRRMPLRLLGREADCRAVQTFDFARAQASLAAGYRENGSKLSVAEASTGLSVSGGNLVLDTGPASLSACPRAFTSAMVAVAHDLDDAVLFAGWWTDFDDASPAGTGLALDGTDATATRAAFADWPDVAMDFGDQKTHAIAISATLGPLLLRQVSATSWYVVGVRAAFTGFLDIVASDAHAGMIHQSGDGTLGQLRTMVCLSEPDYYSTLGGAIPNSGDSIEFAADLIISVQISSAANSKNTSVYYRWVDANNYWRLSITSVNISADSFTVTLTERTAGVSTNRYSATVTLGVSGLTGGGADIYLVVVRATGREHYVYASAGASPETLEPVYLGRFVQSGAQAQDAETTLQVTYDAQQPIEQLELVGAAMTIV